MDFSLKVQITTKIHMTTFLNCSSSFKRDLKCNALQKHYRCTALVQNIWIQNWTPLLKRVPALAPAFSLEKQNPISNRIKAHNLQICIIDINLVSLFIWLQSFQPSMPINFVNPTPHILATWTISYLARPPWHTSSSSARQVHPRPLSPLCSASHHLLRNLEKNSIFMISSW